MITALVVDDVLMNLHLLQAILSGGGMSVVCANDGAAALELARTSRPDVIISDILMPRMDGFAFCRECRRDPALRSVPFVFYTATYTDPRDEQLALSMGADRFLVKPLEPDTLLAEIREVMQRVAAENGAAGSTVGQEEQVVLRQYNQALVRKLERKLVQLEAAIEQRDANERTLEHLNAVLSAIRSINQLIVRERNPAELVRQSCDVLMATSGFEAAWIAVPGKGGEPLVAAQRGFPAAGFECLLAGVRRGEWPGCCRVEEARRTGVVRANRGADCGLCLLGLGESKSSGVVVPLVYSGRVHGVLGVMVASCFAGVEEGSSLLEEVGGDLAFALHSIESEAVRRESEETLAAIFEKVRDGILLIDAETHRLLRANPEMYRMLRCDGQDIATLTLDDIHPEDGLEIVRGHFATHCGTEEEHLLESIPVRRRDGSVFFADVNATTLAFQGRDCLLGVFRDVTERQQAEREKERLRAQLDQAQKMESIGRLAGGVAHDFNNMLSVIVGHVEFALEGLAPEHPLRSDLTEIHMAARRSADLTRQLLAFARKQTVEPRVLDVNRTVADMHGMLRRLIGEDIELVWHPGAGVWPVMMDPSQIDQTLANLCVNARDAIADQGRIVVETANVTFDDAVHASRVGLGTGHYVMLAVTDDGSGMDQETMGRLFEPFFTTKEVGKGTGLGLATVYGIVKQNGGAIEVHSELGCGTTFKIYIPRCVREVGEPSDEQDVNPEVGGDETVLLVEDEPSILRVTAAMLERQGYTVVQAGSGNEAVELAESHPGKIGLLLTDVVMPNMNGRELAQALRSRHPDLAVLFMSGYTPSSLVLQDVLEEGAMFIGKPFSRSELGRKVRQALAARE